MSKLEEMKRMSLEAAEKVEPILIDMKSPFKPIELLQVNEKDVSWQKEALALIVYYSLHYSGNLETLSKLVAIKNPVAGIIFSIVGKGLKKLATHYHLKQYKLGF